MSYRSLALVLTAFCSLPVVNADAQSVYVAPGGVYIGGGPIYVAPAPGYGVAPYAAPTYGYAPPAVVPGPAIVAPTTVYDPPLAAYAAEFPPRPPAPVPYYGGRCGYGYWPSC